MTIILSYRRDDTRWITGRIFDRLEQRYGRDHVFMDIDAIPYGLDFRKHIRKVLQNCDVMLAIIGPRWLAPGEDGQSRLHDETDWVRIEIEAALSKNVPVIPVRVDGASLPHPRLLPESLRELVFRQAAELDTGRDFHTHIDRLIRSMDQFLEQVATESEIAASFVPVLEAIRPEPIAPSPISVPSKKQPQRQEDETATATPSIAERVAAMDVASKPAQSRVAPPIAEPRGADESALNPSVPFSSKVDTVGEASHNTRQAASNQSDPTGSAEITFGNMLVAIAAGTIVGLIAIGTIFAWQ